MLWVTKMQTSHGLGLLPCRKCHILTLHFYSFLVLTYYCPPLRGCKKYCKYGFTKDSAGCNECKCKLPVVVDSGSGEDHGKEGESQSEEEEERTVIVDNYEKLSVIIGH